MGREDDELTRQKEAVDLVRRRMINVVGHELRTPVSALRGLTEAMATADDRLLRDELIPAVARSAARLERLVDDLLLAAGVLTVLPTALPRPDRVRPAIDEAWNDLGQDGGLQVRGPDDVRVLARPRSLRTIMLRVLDNAVKYGAPPVSVSIAPAGSTVAVEVAAASDVPDADLELAFEPFFRGERAVTTTAGFGIGLPVARALAEHDGGSLRLRRDGDRVVARLEMPAP